MSEISSVLLVDDDETASFISKMMLLSIGIENVDAVLSAKQACDYLVEKRPDFIFLDISMPIMDGWEFLEEIKRIELCPDVKVAMLTSSIHPDDKKMAENYDCVIAYLEKPLTKENVKEIKYKLEYS
ncbi:MAG: response regulator [Flavobacteriales bacterium]|nr:response regulator [Flavobacteriales bacterium]